MLLSKRHVEPRVLLIEDAEETQELSRLALESQACQVVAVSSAEAALGLLNAGERFDLLFTDVHLGGISGIEAANRVREHLPQLPILVTSGMDQHAVLPRLLAGIHFLPKPYGMSELLDAIRLCFRHAAEATLVPPPAASAA
ncbi:response regulator [Stenotrophomonas sp. 24(2023)]|uniref:response regulator n=1 Tax=Stenotrophomonas sp. 24(2023) TaxID=3068324 RepID=UPI0027E177BE|nr:response regulator [Stenotrophomonas sp. 24(2023)]WMJ70228.1 response regulator [Stenotrophomonas sp. 24(2023)]